MAEKSYKNQFGDIFHPEISLEELKKLYCEQGMPIRDIAKIYNTSYSYVLKLRKEYQLERTVDQKQIAFDRRKQKSEATNLQKYGCLNPMQNAEVHQKSVKTNLEKYGVENPFQAESCKQKVKNTCLERYGVEHPLSNEDIQKKLKLNNLEKYGVENYVQSEDFLLKRDKTCIERYGTKYPVTLPEIKLKNQKTCYQRYGVPYYSQSEKRKTQLSEINEKRAETCLIKYGVPTFLMTDKCIKARKVALMNKPKSPYKPRLNSRKPRVAPFTSDEFRALAGQGYTTVQEFAKATGTSITVIERRVHQFNCQDLIDGSTSGPEKELSNLLDTMGIVHYKTRQIIPPYELDIYCPDYNIAIEYNGSWWHREEKIGKFYHRDKSFECSQKGIFLFHIFEYEWMDNRKRNIIISQLQNLFKKNIDKIYGRNTYVGFPSKEEKKIFLQENHLQGNDRSNIEIGLYNGEELQCLMTFCKPRFNKKYTWELSRFCVKKGINVIGGASKLFKYFTNNFLKKEETIISYSNEAKTKGQMYQTLGFHLENVSEPGYIWTNRKNEVFSRYQCQMANEYQIMSEKGFYRVFDCGNKVWVYNKS